MRSTVRWSILIALVLAVGVVTACFARQVGTGLAYDWQTRTIAFDVLDGEKRWHGLGTIPREHVRELLRVARTLTPGQKLDLRFGKKRWRWFPGPNTIMRITEQECDGS